MNKTKKAIFNAGIAVFSKSGYNGATVDDIALEAGVAKGTLYYHFKSKEDIFNFIIQEGLNMLENELQIIEDENLDPIETLNRICKLQLTLLYNDKDFFKVIISQLWGQELRQSELRNKLFLYIHEIEKVMQSAMDKGLLVTGNISLMAYTFFGSLISAAVYEVSNMEKMNLDEVIDNVTNIALNGILKKNTNSEV
ncbi:transcriptional regulator, TetR family [Clostridium cavendishii DSM 21758]|uniref:Transcriptional regulator, TetR family n=1 Tax=Clostridium cavendishii DSM 21758 TaxID=1121302 RepID=A0A1M6STU7_9CLOT|nr:TetR/AcrR family transcriptional regulator [Clostridium cavendishii]SHK48162.1 transcriptional regulator, TetR family [Clostridium cavendishii DSM 21758]